jgi:hypothetical protein
MRTQNRCATCLVADVVVELAEVLVERGDGRGGVALLALHVAKYGAHQRARQRVAPGERVAQLCRWRVRHRVRHRAVERHRVLRVHHNAE